MFVHLLFLFVQLRTCTFVTPGLVKKCKKKMYFKISTHTVTERDTLVEE